MAGIDIKVHRDFDCFIELCFRVIFDDVDRFIDGMLLLRSIDSLADE
jgi:hypothetical protein